MKATPDNGDPVPIPTWLEGFPHVYDLLTVGRQPVGDVLAEVRPRHCVALPGQAGLVVPKPKKRPKSSFMSFRSRHAEHILQADFSSSVSTAATASDSESLTWLDDCSGSALSVTGHIRVTGPIVLAEFRRTVATHGFPPPRIPDNGMVFTTRLSGGRT